MQRILPMRGALVTKYIRGGIDAPWSWKLRNQLTTGYLRGWLGKYVAAPVARFFGVLTVTGELRAMLYHADGTYIDYGLCGIYGRPASDRELGHW